MLCKGVFIPKGGWTVFLCENTGLISSFLRAPYCSIGSTSIFVLEIKQEFPVWEMSRSVKTAFFSGALKFSLDQDSQMRMQCKCVCSGIHLQDYCKAEAGMFLFWSTAVSNSLLILLPQQPWRVWFWWDKSLDTLCYHSSFPSLCYSWHFPLLAAMLLSETVRL